MGSNSPEFKFVTAVAKANVYFDGKVVSHTIFLPDNSRKTLGLIYPGKFHFGTDAAERMEIIAGECHVKLDDEGRVGAPSPTAKKPTASSTAAASTRPRCCRPR